jgi:hypothetical protein
MTDDTPPNGFKLNAPHIPNAPWWAQALLFIIGWLGPSIVIAALFISMWAGWITSPITTNTEILKRIESKTDVFAISAGATAVQMLKSDEKRDVIQEKMLQILSVMCRNAAQSSMDRDRCEGYWRRP